MLDIDSTTLKAVIAKRKAEVAQKIKDTIHPDEAERVTLNPGYIANSIADLRALDEMLNMALYIERIERENAQD